MSRIRGHLPILENKYPDFHTAGIGDQKEKVNEI